MSLQIANQQRRMRVPVKRLQAAVRNVLRGERASLNLSLALVTNRAIRVLNRKFLKHDYVTDVLAFALEAPKVAGEVHGEIVVSTDYAFAEAKRRGIPAEEELIRYVVHGTLHLLGYDDHAPRERKRMWERQERYVAVSVQSSAFSKAEGRRLKADG